MDPISKLDPSMYGSTISQPHDRVATLQFLENPPLPAWMDAGEIGGNMYDSSVTQFMGRYRTDIGYDNDEDNNGNSIQHGQEQTVRIGEDGEREPMFEKPLTPSDVGKLNRLVIPKQHAERFFPLDGEAGEKGLQLSFEDEVGKVWRFRYSYWNSSQSYVLTKGWSRFVKEKRLDAGDVVSFERYRPDGERFYIGWRRRSAASSAVVQENGTAPVVPSTGIMWGPLFYPLYPPYPSPPLATCNNIEGEPVNGNSTAPATSKRLRLFGVNLDCPADGPPETDSSHWLINDGTHTSFPPGNHCNCSSSQI